VPAADNRGVTLSSAEIRAKALEIGFTSVGIVAAKRLETAEARLKEWLARGHQGTMAWMEREPEKRADPGVFMPGCRSVVVCTLNYYTPSEHIDSPSHGKISRYAWGDDYHDVLREKLNAMIKWVHGRAPDVQAKICVDTAPFMDKAWAAHAGLGWIGKHTNLITRDVGSWVFIGSILLDAELEYDRAKMEDHCGSCTACIDACPTDAICEPYIVDSTRCISYATIELRDEKLPDEIADNMNGWIYGCDICQDVCPWNRFEKPTSEMRFEPRNDETSLDLAAMTQMAHDDYVQRFRGSAIKRAKLTGLQRNARALGEPRK
jgi:epoxyqueuosine reductase